MAYISNYTGKDGRRGFRFFARKTPNAPKQSLTWFPEDSWSARVVEREKMRAYAAFEHEVKTGAFISKKEKRAEKKQETDGLTFREFTEDVFLPDLKRIVELHTLASYQADLKNHIYPEIGSMQITAITVLSIHKLLQKMMQPDGDRKAPIKVATRRKTYQHLSKIFACAVKLGVLSDNPMIKVERPQKTMEEKNTQPEEQAYDELEALRILQAFSDDVALAQQQFASAVADGKPGIKERQELLTAMKWKAYFLLLMYSGCRRSEIIGIHPNEINDSTGEIQILRSVNYVPEKGIYFGLPKSKKTRTVAVPMHVIASLKDYIAILDEQRDSCGIKLSERDENYIFAQDDLISVMHPDTPTRFFAKFGKRHKFKNLHPHKMRHTFATISIENGAPIADVSSILGHASPEITLRIYTHEDKRNRLKVTGIFDKALSGVTNDLPKA